MKIVRDPDQLPDDLRGGAVAIGNFDGVHLGHARIVSRLIQRAREVQGPAVVLTFDPHPVRLLRPEEVPPPLTWTERKAELLLGQGIDGMFAYPTTEAFLQLSAQEFFDTVVCDLLGAQALIEGPNFYFGRNRGGDVVLLEQLCRKADIGLDVVEPYRLGESDQFVSSSRVRRLLAAGDVDAACQLLTRPYRIRGMITHGAGRGARLGFPTANLEAVDTMLPGEGVYAGRGLVDGQRWPAAINIGPNPTFAEQGRKVEVHLIGCCETLYGRPMEVDFLARLRDIQTFPSVEDLTNQLADDVAQAAAAAAKCGQ